MDTNRLTDILVDALDDLKAQDTQVIDVKHLTSIADFMIFTSGRSNRQVKSLADKVIETAKQLNLPLLGKEGAEQAEWVLVDLGDIIIHIMQPSTRTYYQLEKLWTTENRQLESSN